MTRTAGYKALMGEIRLGDFGDPWGTAMGWLFALAEVTYVEYDLLVPDFQPSPFLRDREDLEGYEQESLLYLIDIGAIDLADIESVFTVMSRYDDWCRLAGRDY
jgi:hypothetical protein